jgi:hypothetical protein
MKTYNVVYMLLVLYKEKKNVKKNKKNIIVKEHGIVFRHGICNRIPRLNLSWHPPLYFLLLNSSH